ncbi:hypothetical protein LBMAG42_44020 [Deltaproteobacteria bacterium]|nr:hypothetical protein LBMAG42_44020 [Deltaproteobacteria bacterium]
MFARANIHFGFIAQSNSMLTRISTGIGCEFKPNSWFNRVNIEFGWGRFGGEARLVVGGGAACRDTMQARSGATPRSRRDDSPCRPAYRCPTTRSAGASWSLTCSVTR